MAGASEYKMLLEPYKRVFADAWRWWGEDQVPRLSAALTFYAMLALAPMLLLAVASAGFLLGEDAVRANISLEVERSMGDAQAIFIDSLLKGHSAGTGAVAILFSIGVLIFGAAGLFEQLRDSVNAIWGTTSLQGGFLPILQRKAFGVLAVVATAVALLAWMFLDARLQWLSKQTVDAALPFWKAASFVVSWAFSGLLFAAIFKLLPRKKIAWRDVVFAAGITALFFGIGKYLLSLYFAFASVSAAYGAAGALVVILLWIYYSSQILFFGVELSNAYAYSMGSLKGLPHDSETKIAATGQVEESPKQESSTKDDHAPEVKAHASSGFQESNAPAPSITNSLANLGQSLGELSHSLGALGKTFTGRNRDKR